MSEDLKCNCEHCGGNVSFPPDYAGQTVACPHCDKPIALISNGAENDNFPKTPKGTTRRKPLQKKPLKRSGSFFGNLKKSLTIAFNKSKRVRLEQVDLRQAEIVLGKTGAEAGLLANEASEILGKIERLKKIEADKARELQESTDYSLSADSKRILSKTKDSVVSKLKYSELDTLYISFSKQIRERCADDPAVSRLVARVEDIEDKIVSYDQVIIELSRDSHFLIRHPFVLLAFVLAICLFGWLGYSSFVQPWWNLHNALNQAHLAALHATQTIDEANQNVELYQQKIKMEQLAELQARVQQRAAEPTIVAGVTSPKSTVASVDRVLQAQSDALDREEYATKLFSSINPNPNVVVDVSLGASTVELKGEGALDIQSLILNKDWMGLMTFVTNEHFSEFPDTRTIDQAYGQLKSMRWRFKAYIRPSFGLKPGTDLYVFRFSDDDRIGFRWDSNTERHPTTIGFLVDYNIIDEKIIIVAGPATFNYRYNVIERYENVYRSKVETLSKQMQLGEIDSDTASSALKALRQEIYNSVLQLALTPK